MRRCRRLVINLVITSAARDLLFAAVAMLLAAPASGRLLEAQARTRIPYRTYVGLNPALVLWTFGSAEVESGLAQGVTLGGSATFTDLDHEKHLSGDVKLRYYPGEVVLRGFSMGFTAGYLRYQATRGEVPTEFTVNAPTIGLIGDYNWLLGGAKRFVVGTGIGAKRVLAGAGTRDPAGLQSVYFTGRFVVGLAF
ncbi:MAG TPA: hypothetical protein VIP11_10195 [Gemmatimonadaceae bacterium]